jgi:hypothetical protein
LKGLKICTPYPIFAGGKIKKNEMGCACGAYGGGESCAHNFGGESGDPDLDGKIILRVNITGSGKGFWRTEWSGLRIGQVAGPCENINNLSVSINAGNFLTSCKKKVASGEGLCCVE